MFQITEYFVMKALLWYFGIFSTIWSFVLKQKNKIWDCLNIFFLRNVSLNLLSLSSYGSIGNFFPRYMES